MPSDSPLELPSNLPLDPPSNSHSNSPANLPLELLLDLSLNLRLGLLFEFAFEFALGFAFEFVCGSAFGLAIEIAFEVAFGCAFEFAFHGESMGYAVGEKFTRAATLALEKKVPFICFAATGGARMQEALISLMQMAKTSAVLERLKIAGVPYVSVMTDPVYGGVSASLAMLGDLNVAEPGARAGFAGPNIIEQTIRQKLPKGFQRSEFLLEKGHIDMIISRDEMRDRLGSILSKLTGQPEPAND